ncbi:hypothetical protein ISN45_Aa05g008600 [Arabidopsis thaliana x Arabidopsis arenosa]|uniref:No apical meristem-associated C-terminal domain-containing protein n=1 Tax=Arabidopsis thaliana x Arabidopsis arenosa TaxID=1240361 RepID=A0A8T1ZIQ4_9BRAS|nr:hypothetical protein ISN45_Aa05g008600 [Arabidopsis thaliana x Arabidopsis arenosa]
MHTKKEEQVDIQRRCGPHLCLVKQTQRSHSRWAKTNAIVWKFVGSYQAATTQMTSGQNDDEWMKLARQIYESDYKKKFMLEHAWRELRHDQKWCASHSTKETGKSKRRKVESGSIHSSETSQAHGESVASQARPLSVKAAKG